MRSRHLLFTPTLLVGTLLALALVTSGCLKRQRDGENPLGPLIDQGTLALGLASETVSTSAPGSGTPDVASPPFTIPGELDEFTPAWPTDPALALGPFIRGLTASSAEIVWATAQDTLSRVKVHGPEGVITTTGEGGPNTRHAVKVSGLHANTSYSFQVDGQTSNGAPMVSASQIFVTPSMVATPTVVPIIFDVQVRNISSQSAVINWKMDRATGGRVQYRTSTGPDMFASDLRPLREHAITLQNLIGSTTYSFIIRTVSAQYGEALSDPGFFTTVEITPPQISFASATQISSNSAVIAWRTDEPATTQVEYGLTQALGRITPFQHGLREGHLVPLRSLQSGSIYHYRIRSMDRFNNGSFFEGSFQTIDGIAPTALNIQVSHLTGTSASITFSTDEPAFAVVGFGIGNTLTETPPNIASQTVFAISLTGLVPHTTYTFRVRAWDSLFNSGHSSNRSFVTPDTRGPVISQIRTTEITADSALISWTTSEDSTTMVEWGSMVGVYTNVSPADPLFRRIHSVRITGLGTTPIATWHYRIVSRDTLGNLSSTENRTFNVPLALSNILVDSAELGSNSALITWTTNASATSLVEYGVGSALASHAPMLPFPPNPVTSHAVRLSGLIPDTVYSFRVRSRDPAGAEVVSRVLVLRTNDSGPPIISQVRAHNITAASAVISWLTDKKSSTVVEYGTSPGTYVMRAVSSVPWSTNHTVTLGNLQGGRTYHYRVRSVDAAGRETISSEQSFLTPGSTAPLITVVQALDLAETSVLISWRTDHPATSQVDHGTTAMVPNQTALSSVATTTHRVAITNLSRNTTYFFRVRSRNEAGLESTSTIQTFRTLDLSPPTITDILIMNVAETTASILWRTDKPSDTQVEYWDSSQVSRWSTRIPTLSMSHRTALIGLTANTTYSFRVHSRDQFNNQAVSNIATFTTLDRSPPRVANINLVGLATSGVTITWTTDEAATSQVEYGLTATFGRSRPDFPTPTALVTAHSVALTGLAGATTYHFRIRSIDAAGNQAVSPKLFFTTVDLLPPIISGILVQRLAATSTEIVWTTNEPSTSFVAYGLTTAYGSQAGNTLLVTRHAVTLHGLNEQTTYQLQVRSTDQAGNVATGPNVSFTTLDRTPPIISGITTPLILENAVTIAWNTNEPGTSRVDYGLSTAFGSSSQVSDALISSHSISLIGLSPLTPYHFRVRSRDGSGNERISGNFTFTTSGTLLIQNILVSGVTSTQAMISWTTTAPATCEITHGNTTTPVVGPLGVDTLPNVTAHSVMIPLQGAPRPAGSLYYFQIQALAANGTTRTSGIRSFLVP